MPPVARLMAFSIVSSGTEESRAFWYIVRSDGFISGSGPPSRAATSTWRISLANTFARLASVAPFLCLIVAHLEWPDIGPPDRTSTFWRRSGSNVDQVLRHFAGCEPTRRAPGTGRGGVGQR